MNRPTPTPERFARPLGFLLLAGLLLVALPASAQVIKVTSAVPGETEQGALGVVVTIGGENFVSGAKVNFYVSGTTNPGGITVKSVRFKDSKNLEATIDVAPDAQTTLKFDVQVKCNSRTGKGTELFKVLVKTTGGDVTPPGTISILQPLESSWGSAVLTWTAPADDGYSDGGPAVSYDLRIRKADCGPFTLDIWVDDTRNGIWADPCHAIDSRPAAGPVGSQESISVGYLAPNTRYVAAIRAVDDSPQGPNWSALPSPIDQTYFTTSDFPGEGWTAPWSATIFDACPPANTTCTIVAPPRLDLDPAGQPGVLYVKQGVPMLAKQSGGTWTTQTLPIAIDTGNYAYDFAFDPASGEALVASLAPNVVKSPLRFYRRSAMGWTTETVAQGAIRFVTLEVAQPSRNVAVPTIVFRHEKTGSFLLKVAQRKEGGWTVETVGSGIAGAAESPFGLAFDAQGIPAVAFPQTTEGIERAVFALRQESGWIPEIPDPNPPGPPWTRVVETQVAFDPVRRDFLIAAKYRDDSTYESVVRLCYRTQGDWNCDEMARDGLRLGLPIAVDGRGRVFFASSSVSNDDPMPTWVMRVRDPGTGEWSAEAIDWNARSTHFDPRIRIAPDGEPVVAYNSNRDSSGVGGSSRSASVSFAKRSAQ